MKLSPAVRATFITIILLFTLSSCSSQPMISVTFKDIYPSDIKTGAERTDVYFPWIQGKKVGIVANHSSTIGSQHLVDSLLKAGIQVVKVFCPEHGFRGEAEAGKYVENAPDSKTGLPVVSLYGKKRKPAPEDLKGLDVILFDIQDVGVRIYTYTSTMHYVMEACAENNVEFVVLDRPNPNGHYIDGPVLEKEFTSFIGMHTVPMVHGMTIAEYAGMINGEGWLKNAVKCKLKTVTVYNYNHSCYYQLPVKPSPNLSSMEAVYLYPSLGFFEGTIVSIGRGTDKPFRVVGHPQIPETGFSFTPVDLPGIATDPPCEGKLCHGYNLSDFATEFLKYSNQIYIFPLLETYRILSPKTEFFNSGFNRVAGTAKLKEQIIAGKTEAEIRATWQEDIKKFKTIRKKYLLYPDFE